MAGRNAAQLRADATATGLFNGPRRNYVGNGYSVPYEAPSVAGVPAGYSMWGYKYYLDTNYLEYSRLHDWLYTPYGKLINATQQEADDALQEELATQSVPDSIIVGNCCRGFGFLYFGTSQVGYFGEEGSTFGDNMALAEPNTPRKVDANMAIKIVILFQQTTQFQPPEESVNYATIPRTAGWSESLYGPDDVSLVIRLLKGPRVDPAVFPLLQARANLLNNQASIIGARLYQGSAGKGQLVAASYNGNNGAEDQPGASLLLSATSTTTGQSRRWLMRGMVDDDIVGGEWNPDDDTVHRFQEYKASLAQFGWMAQTNANELKILDIDNTGLVRTEGTVPWAILTDVTIKNTTAIATGRRVGGKFRISAVPNTKSFQVTNWPYGDTTGGRVSIVSSAFQTFGNATFTVVRTSFRKVGRPFAGYRGRKSRRRTTA